MRRVYGAPGRRYGNEANMTHSSRKPRPPQLHVQEVAASTFPLHSLPCTNVFMGQF